MSKNAVSRPQAPVQTALVIQSPEPVTVAAPDTADLVRQYTDEILPLARYVITTPEQFVQANLDWQKARKFSTAIDKLFADACDKAHKAHAALTSLRAQLKAPADQIAAHVGNEILRFKAEEDRKRREEEARLQAEENARLETERQRLQAIADQERAEAEARFQSALADRDPWEVEEDKLPVVPEPVIIALPDSAPVRLASSVPTVMGGPRTVDKPWSCVIDDPAALLRWVLEKPAERLMLYVSFNLPALNTKARELGAELGRVIPGTRGVREQTLKRA